jgi:hypothetical protein
MKKEKTQLFVVCTGAVELRGDLARVHDRIDRLDMLEIASQTGVSQWDIWQRERSFPLEILNVFWVGAWRERSDVIW